MPDPFALDEPAVTCDVCEWCPDCGCVQSYCANHDPWKEIARLRRRVKRLEKALKRVLAEDHHWCHDSSRDAVDCGCPKTRRDIRIREALDGKDVG